MESPKSPTKDEKHKQKLLHRESSKHLSHSPRHHKDSPRKKGRHESVGDKQEEPLLAVAPPKFDDDDDDDGSETVIDIIDAVVEEEKKKKKKKEEFSEAKSAPATPRRNHSFNSDKKIEKGSVDSPRSEKHSHHGSKGKLEGPPDSKELGDMPKKKNHSFKHEHKKVKSASASSSPGLVPVISVAEKSKLTETAPESSKPTETPSKKRDSLKAEKEPHSREHSSGKRGADKGKGSTEPSPEGGKVTDTPKKKGNSLKAERESSLEHLSVKRVADKGKGSAEPSPERGKVTETPKKKGNSLKGERESSLEHSSVKRVADEGKGSAEPSPEPGKLSETPKKKSHSFRIEHDSPSSGHASSKKVSDKGRVSGETSPEPRKLSETPKRSHSFRTEHDSPSPGHLALKIVTDKGRMSGESSPEPRKLSETPKKSHSFRTDQDPPPLSEPPVVRASDIGKISRECSPEPRRLSETPKKKSHSFRNEQKPIGGVSTSPSPGPTTVVRASYGGKISGDSSPEPKRLTDSLRKSNSFNRDQKSNSGTSTSPSLSQSPVVRASERGKISGESSPEPKRLSETPRKSSSFKNEQRTGLVEQKSPSFGPLDSKPAPEKTETKETGEQKPPEKASRATRMLWRMSRGFSNLQAMLKGQIMQEGNDDSSKHINLTASAPSVSSLVFMTTDAQEPEEKTPKPKPLDLNLIPQSELSQEEQTGRSRSLMGLRKPKPAFPPRSDLNDSAPTSVPHESSGILASSKISTSEGSSSQPLSTSSQEKAGGPSRNSSFSIHFRKTKGLGISGQTESASSLPVATDGTRSHSSMSHTEEDVSGSPKTSVSGSPLSSPSSPRSDLSKVAYLKNLSKSQSMRLPQSPRAAPEKEKSQSLRPRNSSFRMMRPKALIQSEPVEESQQQQQQAVSLDKKSTAAAASRWKSLPKFLRQSSPSTTPGSATIVPGAPFIFDTFSDPYLAQSFMCFLQSRHAEENGLFMLDLHSIYIADTIEARKEAAEHIYETYVKSGASFELNLTDFMREEALNRLKATPPVYETVFSDIRDAISLLLEQSLYPAWIHTNEWKKRPFIHLDENEPTMMEILLHPRLLRCFYAFIRGFPLQDPAWTCRQSPIRVLAFCERALPFQPPAAFKHERSFALRRKPREELMNEDGTKELSEPEENEKAADVLGEYCDVMASFQTPEVIPLRVLRYVFSQALALLGTVFHKRWLNGSKWEWSLFSVQGQASLPSLDDVVSDKSLLELFTDFMSKTNSPNRGMLNFLVRAKELESLRGRKNSFTDSDGKQPATTPASRKYISKAKEMFTEFISEEGTGKLSCISPEVTADVRANLYPVDEGDVIGTGALDPAVRCVVSFMQENDYEQWKEIHVWRLATRTNNPKQEKTIVVRPPSPSTYSLEISSNGSESRFGSTDSSFLSGSHGEEFSDGSLSSSSSMAAPPLAEKPQIVSSPLAIIPPQCPKVEASPNNLTDTSLFSLAESTSSHLDPNWSSSDMSDVSLTPTTPKTPIAIVTTSDDSRPKYPFHIPPDS